MMCIHPDLKVGKCLVTEVYPYSTSMPLRKKEYSITEAAVSNNYRIYGGLVKRKLLFLVVTLENGRPLW